jgi:hypothetical protein
MGEYLFFYLNFGLKKYNGNGKLGVKRESLENWEELKQNRE